MGSNSGRFFGWVIGGTLPVAIAADGSPPPGIRMPRRISHHLPKPSSRRLCGEWLKELLGIPKSASFAFVTGCQMAHTTALAAARNKLLKDRGWDVEDRPCRSTAARILTTAKPTQIDHAIRSAARHRHGGDRLRCNRRIGDASISGSSRKRFANGAGIRSPLASGRGFEHGRLRSFRARLSARPCRERLGACRRCLRPLGRDEQATLPSARWSGAGGFLGHGWHKWLNVPFDSGLVFVAHPSAHRAAFAQDTSYSVPREKCAIKRIGIRNGRARARGFRGTRQSERSVVPELVRSWIGAALAPSA